MAPTSSFSLALERRHGAETRQFDGDHYGSRTPDRPLRPDVRDMDRLFCCGRPGRARLVDVGMHGSRSQCSTKTAVRAMHRDNAEGIAFLRATAPNLASQMRVAFSNMAWNTGFSSPGELR